MLFPSAQITRIGIGNDMKHIEHKFAMVGEIFLFFRSNENYQGDYLNVFSN